MLAAPAGPWVVHGARGAGNDLAATAARATSLRGLPSLHAAAAPSRWSAAGSTWRLAALLCSLGGLGARLRHGRRWRPGPSRCHTIRCATKGGAELDYASNPETREYRAYLRKRKPDWLRSLYVELYGGDKKKLPRNKRALLQKLESEEAWPKVMQVLSKRQEGLSLLPRAQEKVRERTKRRRVAVSTLRRLRREPQTLGPGGVIAGLDEELSWSEIASADTGSELPAFFDLRLHASGEGERAPLTSIDVGMEFKGVVTGISLLEGVRIDVGAEADALLPADLNRDGELAESLKRELPLDAGVTVRVREVFNGPHDQARRFPIIVDLVAPEIAELAGSSSPSSCHAFRLHHHDDPEVMHEARGSGPASGFVGVETDDYDLWEGELDLEHLAEEPDGQPDWRRLWESVQKLPPRLPQEEVVSITGQRKPEVIQVPEGHREATFQEVSEDSEELTAWRELATEELRYVHYELKCLEKLARDLDVVEADLEAGRKHSIPASLVGTIALECGQRCLRAKADGDCLRFELLKFDSPEELSRWWDKQKATPDEDEDEDEAEREKRRLRVLEREKKRLRVLFKCADARHARLTRRVEEAEIRKQQADRSIHQAQAIEDSVEAIRAEIDKWQSDKAAEQHPDTLSPSAH